LRALVAAEVLELLARLKAHEILDRVKIRARVRLDRDAILWPQHREIEHRHEGGERRGRRLVAANFQAVVVGAKMIGVVDRPGR